MNTASTHNPSTINGPFLTREALGQGWLTKRQLYSPLFTKLFHGVHLPAAIHVTHAVRCHAAALLAPSDAVLTGLSAAAVRGVDLTSVDSPVEMIVPVESGFRAQRGMNIRRTTMADVGSEPWRTIRIATPLRMAMDVLTNTSVRTSLPRRVAILDVFLRQGCVEVPPLRRLLSNCNDHGVVSARQALALADSRAESIPESELRVWLALAGVTCVPQLAVYAGGVFVGRLDLGIEACKLAIEYDGEWHGDAEQVEHDGQRRAALRDAGWECIVVRKADLYGDPRGMVFAILEAIRRRSR